jgi:small-conductance mechanosensitive channel
MFQDVLQRTFFHNSILDYLICLSIFLIGIVLIRVFKNLILSRLQVWARRTATTIDDFLTDDIKRKLPSLLYFGAFYLSIQRLTLNPTLEKAVDVLAIIFLTIFGVSFLLAMIIYGLETYWVTKERDTDKKQALKGILTVIKFVVWSIAIIILLDNLGIKISALVAGLGIGGVAIALAAQAILGDLFSYFSIFFDRPFEIGDFIITGDCLGTVEHIGIKTTRVRSLGGEQLIFPNTDLTNSRVHNYKRMDRRRVLFQIGVTYQTSLQHLKEIPEIIKNVIKGMNDTEFDRAHFSSYGDFSLVFEIVYYVIGSGYNKYMDIQQEINYKIKEEFDKCGIEFAFPTQTLYLNKM